MKMFYKLVLLLVLFSCKEKVENKLKKSNEIIQVEFQEIIDASNVKGAILIYDLKKNAYYSNDFGLAKKGELPASTFKIPNSMIALETGIIKNDSTLLKWDGKKRRMKRWEQDLTFTKAFHLSCVPCYQEIARKVGVVGMNTYLQKLSYKGMMVDTTSIDMFWLEGNSRINQVQQIDFLKRFYKSELEITKRTETIMKRLMLIEKTAYYAISGKTGWSTTKDIHNGWFVGYVETEGNTYFFSTNVSPKKGFDMRLFSEIRKEIVYKALEKLDVIKYKAS